MNKFDSPNDMVIARGTEEGLVLRIDGRNSKERLLAALQSFLMSRRRFLTGSRSVVLEWLEETPSADLVDQLTFEIQSEFGITLKSGGCAKETPTKLSAGAKVASGRLPQRVRTSHGGVEANVEVTVAEELIDDSVSLIQSAVDVSSKETGVTENLVTADSEFEADAEESGIADAWGTRLFEGIRKLQGVGDMSLEKLQSLSSSRGGDIGALGSAFVEDDSKIIFHTLRSGQRVEHQGTVVIVGDVNSGAEVIAGGDVLVLGVLRGVAHAGAYHESGSGRLIFALDLRPTQLRIGGMITRGTIGDLKQRPGPEYARIEGDAILVEPYNSRTCAQLFARRVVIDEVAL